MIDEKGRKYVLKDEEIKNEFQTDLGVLKREHIIKAQNGDLIYSHLGYAFRILKPNFEDLLARFKRGPQIVPLKDCALIATYSGIKSGSFVVDGGTGGGVLACFLANLVRPNGHVVSYEIRKDYIEIAKWNRDFAGLTDWLDIKKSDIYDGIKEKDLDLVTLDVPSPWKAVEHAQKALKLGGFLVGFIPTVLQVKRFCDKITKTKNLRLVRCIEIMERGWKVVGRILRPTSMMLGHTGFLVFARKF